MNKRELIFFVHLGYLLNGIINDIQSAEH